MGTVFLHCIELNCIELCCLVLYCIVLDNSGNSLLLNPSAHHATVSIATAGIRAAVSIPCSQDANKVDKIDYWSTLRLLRGLPAAITVGISDRIGAALLTFVR